MAAYFVVYPTGQIQNIIEAEPEQVEGLEKHLSAILIERTEELDATYEPGYWYDFELGAFVAFQAEPPVE